MAERRHIMSHLTHPQGRFISLRTKLVLFISLIIIAVCSGLSWYFIHQQTESLTQSLMDTGAILAKNLAHNSRSSLAVGDKPNLQRFIDGAMEVEEVVYVVMTGSERALLLSRSKGVLIDRTSLSRSRAAPLYPDPGIIRDLFQSAESDPVINSFTTLKGETLYDFAVPVRRRDEPEPGLELFTAEQQGTAPKKESLRREAGSVYGLVQVGMTTSKMQQSLNSVIRNVVLITVLIILLGIATAILLANRIITPIKSLAAVARQVAEGDLTASVIPTTRDEVGQLTTLFNLMTLSLAERNKAISANVETIRKQITHLTTLNQASAAITSTLDLDKLFSTVLELLIHNLGFSRMLLVLYDSERGVASIGQVAGVSALVEQTARQIEIPVRDDGGTDAEMLLHGKPLLVHDIDTVAHRMYPPILTLARQAGVISFIGVPLRSQKRVLGYLAADRGTQPCSQEDLDLLMTVASHVAVAIDNARAYSELGTLTQHLEQRVEERTRELQSANERLQEHDLRRTKFVSVASHELRTPMTSIRGFVENMLDGLTGSITERQTHYLNRMKHNVGRLTRIINQLLDWSRIDIKRLELSLEDVCLDDLITDVVESLQTVAAEKGVLLEVTTPESRPTVRADRDKLEQILWNLIGNALKFTPKGGQVSVSLHDKTDGFVELCVADTGCGIAPHELSKVFNEFSKVESTLPGSQGAQLGLFITRNLVMLHGGKITVDSTLGAGSRFCFTIPSTNQTG